MQSKLAERLKKKNDQIAEDFTMKAHQPIVSTENYKEFSNTANIDSHIEKVS